MVQGRVDKNGIIQNVSNDSDKTTDEISLTHDDLKEIGKQYLKEEGYKEDEIKKEHTIKFHDRKYRIDVVGLKNEKVVVAIECGSVSYEKMTVLTNVIKKVVHIPFHTQVVDLNLIRLNKEKVRMEEEIEKLKGGYNNLEMKIENLVPIVNSLDEGVADICFNEILINYMLKNMEHHLCIRQVVKEKIDKVGLNIFGEIPFIFTHDIVEKYIGKRFSLVDKNGFDLIREKLFQCAAEKLLPIDVSTEIRFWSIENGFKDSTLGLVDVVILLNLIVTDEKREDVKKHLESVILEEREMWGSIK